jgi:ATP-dependent protease HslVU (ClpYQ) peptidase subunit
LRTDAAAADEMHAADFQLVTPGGETLSKEEYLAAVASGGRFVFSQATAIS